MNKALRPYRRGRPATIIAALALWVAYWVSAPLNRTEAEDTWDFAWLVERAPAHELVHPHHLLHLPLMRALWRITQWWKPELRPHGVMIGFSALAAAVSVLLLYGLLRRAGKVGHDRAAASALGLAVSYGFWRYAAEAEVYTLAIALSLGAWWCVAGPMRASKRWLAIAVSTVAIWMHVFCVPVVCGAIPFWLWRQRARRAAITHVAATVLLVAIGYLATGQVPRHTIGGPDPLRAEGGVRIMSIARATLALGSTITAANFVFGEPACVGVIERWFPARMIEEEVFLGRAIPTAQRRAAWGTLALTTLMGTGLALTLLRRSGRAAVTSSAAGMPCRGEISVAGNPIQRLDHAWPMPSNAWTLLAQASVAWFGAHALLLLVMEPGNPELWVMALAPLWLTLGVWAERSALQPAVLFAVVGVLGAHNWLGGLQPLRRPEGDLHRARATVVLEIASDGDMIFTAGGTVWSRYLRYHVPRGVRVVDLWREDPPAALSSVKRYLALGDVFEIPTALRARFPTRAYQVEKFAEHWRSHARQVTTDSWGGVWLLSDESAARLSLEGDADPPDAAVMQ